MTEFPSQSHAAREPREIRPVTNEPGRMRKEPAARRLLKTFFLGDARSTFSSMVWDTFVPNLRDNFMDVFHDGIDNLFGGTQGGHRPARRAYRGGSSSQISKHNPAQALGARSEPERYSREDRDRQNVSGLEIGSRAEAQEVLNYMVQTLEQYDLVTLADFYQMVRLPPEHTDYKWGWEDLGGAKIVHSRGGYYLDLPPLIAIR